jgi:hypothetical protein
MQSLVRSVALLATLVVVSGCGDSGDGVVSGEVIVDGKTPLKKGQIRFVPTDAAKKPAEGEVVDGKYSVRVPVGEAKVEIMSPKVVGKIRMMPDSPEVDEVVEQLPQRYNVASTLTIKVTAGEQQKRFDVQSK